MKSLVYLTLTVERVKVEQMWFLVSFLAYVEKESLAPH